MQYAHPGPCNVNRGCTTGWQQLDQDAVGQGWNWTTSNLDKTSSHSRTRGGWRDLQPINWYLTYIYMYSCIYETYMYSCIYEKFGKTWLVGHMSWPSKDRCIQVAHNWEKDLITLSNTAPSHVSSALRGSPRAVRSSPQADQGQWTKELWTEAAPPLQIWKKLVQNGGG